MPRLRISNGLLAGHTRATADVIGKKDPSALPQMAVVNEATARKLNMNTRVDPGYDPRPAESLVGAVLVGYVSGQIRSRGGSSSKTTEVRQGAFGTIYGVAHDGTGVVAYVQLGGRYEIVRWDGSAWNQVGEAHAVSTGGGQKTGSGGLAARGGVILAPRNLDALLRWNGSAWVNDGYLPYGYRARFYATNDAYFGRHNGLYWWNGSSVSQVASTDYSAYILAHHRNVANTVYFGKGAGTGRVLAYTPGSGTTTLGSDAAIGGGPAAMDFGAGALWVVGLNGYTYYYSGGSWQTDSVQPFPSTIGECFFLGSDLYATGADGIYRKGPEVWTKVVSTLGAPSGLQIANEGTLDVVYSLGEFVFTARIGQAPVRLGGYRDDNIAGRRNSANNANGLSLSTLLGPNDTNANQTTRIIRRTAEGVATELSAGLPLTVQVYQVAVSPAGDLFANTSSGAVRWNGSTWVSMGTIGVGADFNKTYMAIGNDGLLYAVFSTAPYLRKWDGAQWVGLTGTGAPAEQIYGISPELGGPGIVGLAIGKAYRYKEGEWDQSTFPTAQLADYSMRHFVETTLDTRYIIANTGSVYKWAGGSSWSLMAGISATELILGMYRTLYAIHGTSVSQWTGSAWLQLGSAFDATINGGYIDYLGRLVIYGGFTGKIKAWDGTTWVPVIPTLTAYPEDVVYWAAPALP